MQEGEGAEAGEGVAGRGGLCGQGAAGRAQLYSALRASAPSSRPAARLKMKPAVVLLLLLLAERAGEVC